MLHKEKKKEKNISFFSITLHRKCQNNEEMNKIHSMNVRIKD